MPETFTRYSKDAVAFLAELSINNDRGWFKANQDRYEASVREPTLALIRAMRPQLAKISKHIVASDKKVGGSMMRPQRDTRFSADKIPYKTNVGVQFRNAAGKDVHAPGFYFHFDPDGVFLAAGMWHPDTPSLAKIRASIDKNPARWKRVLSEKALTGRFELSGDSLKRPPRGYDAEHPMIDLLKRKDHVVVANLKSSALQKKTLVSDLITCFKAAKPYMKLLHDAVGLSF